MGLAELGHAGAADSAVAAVGDEREDAAVAGLDGGDVFAGLDDGAAGLVSEDEGEGHLGGADHEVVVAGAEAGGAHLDEDFAGLGRLLVKLANVERLVGLVEYGGLQVRPLVWDWVRNAARPPRGGRGCGL